jgi:phosphohistidine swiveling domain-containing protein
VDLKQLLLEDKKVDWELFISRHREYAPLFAYLSISSQYPKDRYAKATGIDFAFQYYKRVKNDYFWSAKDCAELRKLLNDQGDNDAAYFTGIVKTAEDHCDKLVEWCHEIRKQDFKSKSNQELLEVWEEYWELLKNAAAFLPAKHNLNIVLEERIMKQLEAKGKKDAAYFRKLLVPTKDTLSIQAEKKLAGLDEKEIDSWLEEFNWIETFCWFGDPLSKDDVKKKMSSKKVEDQSREEFEKIKQELNLEGGLLTEIKALQDLLYVHTFELECLFASKYWCQNLLTEIASRIGLTFETYPYAVYPEIVAGLKGEKIDLDMVLKRKDNNYAIFRFKDDITVLEGEGFNQVMKVERKPEVVAVELTGRPAFPGKVLGKAKIVKSIEEFDKFESGDILVSPMTTPDFNHFLPKVKAIVTDEGGVTCHAAIISRELKIPCIVGTKKATQVFSDGDELKVDANRGIVKKLIK